MGIEKQHHMKLVSALAKSGDKLQIRMEMQLKRTLYLKKTNILLSHFNWNKCTHAPHKKKKEKKGGRFSFESVSLPRSESSTAHEH